MLTEVDEFISLTFAQYYSLNNQTLSTINSNFCLLISTYCIGVLLYGKSNLYFILKLSS